jgi:hypothetical protein
MCRRDLRVGDLAKSCDGHVDHGLDVRERPTRTTSAFDMPTVVVQHRVVG